MRGIVYHMFTEITSMPLGVTTCEKTFLCAHIRRVSDFNTMHVLMRDEKGRKKEASKVKQTTRQRNTAYPRQSLFLRKMSCHGWESNPRHSTF